MLILSFLLLKIGLSLKAEKTFRPLSPDFSKFTFMNYIFRSYHAILETIISCYKVSITIASYLELLVTIDNYEKLSRAIGNY